VVNEKEVHWYLTFYLKYGQNISLEFDAVVISDGENINVVNVSGWKCGIQRLFCEDTATVLVEKQPDPLVADAGGPYNGYVSESIQFTGSATGGVPPYTYAWDLNNDGTYDDSVGVNPTYSWGAIGTYTIHLKVTDTTGTNNTDSAQVTVNERNSPPNTPSTPEGSESGKAKKELTYSSSAVDPNGDKVYLLFDWGDGNTSGWLGPFTSGTSYEITHTWTVKGSYTIKVKAKDIKGEESTWSTPLTISITKNFWAPYITILENLKDRFPAMENLLTALLNILETMRLNHPLFV
jgi:PKD repeat protein